MARNEYIQVNKEWLEAKAKEEGVKAFYFLLGRNSHYAHHCHKAYN